MLIDNNLHDEIKSELLQLNFDNGVDLNRTIDKIRKADSKGEIGSINRIFHNSLRKELKETSSIDKNILERLDKANVYTWIAYTLYDDVLDEGNLELLSPANHFVRLSYLEYLSAGIKMDFLNEYFSIVDLANSTELTLRKNRSLELRLYKQLQSEKSIAHCIGQLWITQQISPQNFKTTLKGCSAYCAARQLSDDIYDWREDLAKGQYTFAAVNILKYAGVKVSDAINENNKSLLNIAFWENELEHLCHEVIRLASLSLKSFSPILEDESEYTNRFIFNLKVTAEKAITNHLSKKLEFEKNST